MDDLRRAALATLSCYTGYPDVPNGRPCGVWAYMPANYTVPMNFAQYPNGQVRKVMGDESFAPEVEIRVVDVPVLDPRSSRPLELYYAAIETNPVGIVVATLPKGTQDLVVSKDRVRRIELGQRRQLLELLDEFGVRAELSTVTGSGGAHEARESDLDLLHVQVIETLISHGYAVSVEAAFDAAVRETREEHGFDLLREISKVVRVDSFVELAVSKRRPSCGIEHYIFAAQVRDFSDALPRVSLIVEEKTPGREGLTYFERGVFLTLPQMWRKFELARAEVDVSSAGWSDGWQLREIRAAQSRLRMIERIERSLVEILGAQELTVASATGPGIKASPTRMNILRSVQRITAS